MTRDLIDRAEAVRVMLAYASSYSAAEAETAMRSLPAVTVDADALARRLYPDDYHDGHDCMGETGREGQPCSICAGRAEWWAMRVQQVKDALAALDLTPAPVQPTIGDRLIEATTEVLAYVRGETTNVVVEHVQPDPDNEYPYDAVEQSKRDLDGFDPDSDADAKKEPTDDRA